MELGAICDFSVLVWQDLVFLWVRMIVPIGNGLKVAWDGEATGAFDIILIKSDASKFGARPIPSDGVMLLEDIT